MGKKFVNFTCFYLLKLNYTLHHSGQKAEILVGVRKMELFNENSTIGRRIIPVAQLGPYRWYMAGCLFVGITCYPDKRNFC